MISGERRGALVLVLAALATITIGALPIIAGVLGAPALAAIARPVHNRLARRMNARASAVIVILCVWVAVVGPGLWLGTAVVRQLPSALDQVHDIVRQVGTAPLPFARTNPDSLARQIGAKSLGWMSTAVEPALGSVARMATDLSIALLGLFFLLVQGDTAWQAVRQRLPFSPEGSDGLRDVFVNVTRGTVYGVLSSAALQGASIGIGLRLIGNDAAAFWGVVAGIATMIPVIGNAVVWVPALVLSAIHHDVRGVVVMIVFGKIVPSVFDRVVKLYLARRLSDTHPLVTLAGVLVGVRLLGPVGVLLGPTLLQSTIALVELYEREYVDTALVT